MTLKGDGMMNMIKEQEFDYYTYTQENPPDPQKIRRGLEARRHRFEAATHKTLIRIDGDILEQFHQLLPDKQDYEHVINQALREWLSAQNIKELVRDELHQMVQTILTSMPTTMPISKKRKAVH
jgi:uncharacterized protein (DUF4415 family)